MNIFVSVFNYFVSRKVKNYEYESKKDMKTFLEKCYDQNAEDIKKKKEEKIILNNQVLKLEFELKQLKNSVEKKKNEYEQANDNFEKKKTETLENLTDFLQKQKHFEESINILSKQIFNFEYKLVKIELNFQINENNEYFKILQQNDQFFSLIDNQLAFIEFNCTTLKNIQNVLVYKLDLMNYRESFKRNLWTLLTIKCKIEANTEVCKEEKSKFSSLINEIHDDLENIMFSEIIFVEEIQSLLSSKLNQIYFVKQKEKNQADEKINLKKILNLVDSIQNINEDIEEIEDSIKK